MKELLNDKIITKVKEKACQKSRLRVAKTRIINSKQRNF